jgi:hypothetical protein
MSARFLAMVVLMLFAGCRSKPPVKIVTADGSVVVDVQTLGEYPTTVTHVRLTEANGPTVWEIRAEQGTPQIHNLTFAPGANPVTLAHPDSGQYEIVVPKGSSFILDPNKTYTVELWGASDQGKPVKSDFRFAH